MNSQSDATNVILINPFVVPAGSEDAAIAMWEQARDFLSTQPGYVATKLHQALAPEAQFTLINVAEWESLEAFKAATAAMHSSTKLPRIEGVFGAPQLYKVIRE